MSWWSTVNLVGLALNFWGALLLVIVNWTNEPRPEEREKNKRLYWWYQTGFRIGMILLCLGFMTFYGLLARMHSRQHELAVYAFDLLQLDGEDSDRCHWSSAGDG